METPYGKYRDWKTGAAIPDKMERTTPPGFNLKNSKTVSAADMIT